MMSLISEKKACCSENLSGSTNVTHTNKTAAAAYRVQLPVSFTRGLVRKKHRGLSSDE